MNTRTTFATMEQAEEALRQANRNWKDTIEDLRPGEQDKPEWAVPPAHIGIAVFSQDGNFQVEWDDEKECFYWMTNA